MQRSSQQTNPVPQLNWTGLALSATLGGLLGLALVAAVVVASFL